jgi:Ca2+-binding RTX toxin-like protein
MTPPMLLLTSTTDAAAIETMSIAATGENFVDVSAFAAITGLTVTGDGSITAVVDVTALETVDASGNTGGVTVDLTGAAADLTVTGGSGNDDITAGAGDDTIDAGAGDDRVAFAAAALDNLDTVAGGDGEDTIAFADADDATALDATAHTAFEVLELGAAGSWRQYL